MENYYKLLEIDREAEKQEIRRAFRRLAKRLHPDISHDYRDFLRILDAYETLIDDRKRRRYNLVLGEAGENAILPKSRVSYAVSLADIARFRVFNGRNQKRRTGNGSFKGYDVCVHLSPGELFRGSSVRIDVPAHVVCPLCRGNRMSCSLCSDRGHITKAVAVTIEIPRNLEDGCVFRVPLREIKRKGYAFFVMKQLLVMVNLQHGEDAPGFKKM
ncbi:MAG TPA: DnaJ domain-containing protein [Spirochaetota bacterium]|nr:DnaJ domain-containing protein [Spirochaetota bacterium]